VPGFHPNQVFNRFRFWMPVPKETGGVEQKGVIFILSSV
jgi:hypothetical protein